MEKLKLFLWNINGSAGHGKIIPVRLIMDQIYKYGRPDIIVLTEVAKYSPGYSEIILALKESGYLAVCSKYAPGQNQIIIAIRDNINGNAEINIREINADEYLKKEAKIASEREKISLSVERKVMHIPNYLRADIKVNGKLLSIVGCRLLTGGYDLRRNYDDESIQFYDVLVPELKKISSDYIIVCGDFNNARKRDKGYQGFAQENYNWHILYDYFVCEEGYKMLDKFITVTYYADNTEIPDDHIFIRGFENECSVECDSFSFAIEQYGYGNKNIEVNKKQHIQGLPDHDILIANISL